MEKSWKSHGIVISDFCGNPVIYGTNKNDINHSRFENIEDMIADTKKAKVVQQIFFYCELTCYYQYNTSKLGALGATEGA